MVGDVALLGDGGRVRRRRRKRRRYDDGAKKEQHTFTKIVEWVIDQ
jgi:hypothetical protein